MIKSWQSKKDKGRKLLVLVTFIIMLVFLTSSSNVAYALNIRDATFYIDINQEGASGSYRITWYDSYDDGANQYSGGTAEKAWQYVNYNGDRTVSSVFNFGPQGDNISSTYVSGNFVDDTPFLYIEITNAPAGKKIKGVRDDNGYMATYQPSKTSIFVDCGIYQGDWQNDQNEGRTPTMRNDNDIYTITIVWEDDPDQFANINVNPMIWNGSSWQEFTDGSYGNFKFSGTDNWQNDVCMDALKGSTTYSITDTRSNRSNVYVEKITKIENGVETQIGTTSTGTQTLNSSVEIRIYYKFTYDVVFNSNPTSVTTRNIYGDTITTNPTGSVSTIKNVRAGNSITMPSGSSLHRTGYEFVGWSTNPSYILDTHPSSLYNISCYTNYIKGKIKETL